MLAVNFADSQRYFLDALLEVHRAHLIMLVEQGIVSPEHGRVLSNALRRLDRPSLAAACFDGSCEDFFFYVEQRIAEHCDPDIAGRLHTARSRNDIDITLYRMGMRRQILRVLSELLLGGGALLSAAAAHVDTLIPAYTHTQPAQPTTLAHYLMAAVEVVERDAVRLRAAYQTVNRCPLGACAITTTGFPINRERTAHLLGFEGLQMNSYGAIAAVDYVLETAGAVATAMVNLGKLTQDLLLWCTQEYGFLRLADDFVQGSSIMPQKRNPVALEHVRIIASRAFAEAQAVVTTAHNTPFGDIVDSEDDLQPLVFTMFDDAARGLRLFAAALGSATFEVERLAAAAGARFVTVTELADTLVREGKVSFREAHRLVSQAVQANPADDRHARIVDDVLRLAPGVAPRETLEAALDPRQFVERRSIPGGPARAAIEPELERAGRVQAEWGEWLKTKRERLQAAHEELEGHDFG